MIDLQQINGIHLATMNTEQNLMCPQWQQAFLSMLSEVEGNCDSGTALVLTGAGKFFSNGLNLELLMALDDSEKQAFAEKMAEIQLRLLTLPCPTVAALNGHAFAGGAFLALACDYRFMREDSGWFCLSEVDVGVPVTLGNAALLNAKLDVNVARNALLTGHRYTAEDAVKVGIADGMASEQDLVDTALSYAKQLSGKGASIYASLKRSLYAPAVAQLKRDQSGESSQESI